MPFQGVLRLAKVEYYMLRTKKVTEFLRITVTFCLFCLQLSLLISLAKVVVLIVQKPKAS